MGALGVVELQRTSDRIEHLLGGAGQITAFEPGVVLDAEPGERSDFTATQPRYAPTTHGREADLCRGDLASARHQELSGFATTIHASRVNAAPAAPGRP